MLKKILWILICFVLFGCQQKNQEWNPIFEETSFNYFDTNIKRSLSLIDAAYAEANNNKPEAVKEILHKAKNDLLAIKDYYIPLTAIRQKIYDADRNFKLNRVEKTGKLLKDSKAIISSLDSTTKNKVFDKVIVDLSTKFDEVITSLDEDSKQYTYDKMKILGEHVNLMLNKGDLVLSGIEFDK